MYKLTVAVKPSRAFISVKIFACSHWQARNLHALKSCGQNSTKLFSKSNHAHAFRLSICRYFSWQQWPYIVSSSKPVHFAQETLVSLHDYLGVTWFPTLVIAVLGIRTCVTLPLAVYQNYIMAKYENIQSEIAEIAEELAKETNAAVRMYKWEEKTAKFMYQLSLKQHIQELIIRENCHPAKGSILVIFQLPIWISLTFALRNMVTMLPPTAASAYVVYLQMSLGGALWFTNLTVPDPVFVMPVLMGLVNMAIVELYTLRKVDKQRSRVQKAMTNIMRVVSVVMVPVAASLPSAISLYWLISSIFGLGQNILLLLPRFRRFCQIPVTPSESSTPFKDILEGAKKKLRIS